MSLPAGGTRHPWNPPDFAFALPDAAPTTLTPAQREQFGRDGFVVVPDVVSGAELEDLTAELDELEAKVDEFLAAQEKGRVNIAEHGAITFTVHAVLRSAAAKAFAHNPVMVGVARDVLGPDVNLYWDQAVYKKPEKPREFPWHQDTGYTFTEPQHYLTCWVSLNGATVDNGCPWILPGAHTNGTLLHRWADPIGWQCLTDAEGAVPAEVPAGGMVAFSSLTPHLTGPNRTDGVRKAYIVQYAVAGSHTITGDWPKGAPPNGANPCDDPDCQFPVLRDGVAVGDV